MKLRVPKGSGGFSLVEVVVATVLLGIIVSAGLSLYLNQQKQWLIGEQIAEMQQNLRVSMDELVRNLRMAGCGYFPSGLNPILSTDADPDTLVLRQNLNDCLVEIGKDVKSHVIHTMEDDLGCFVPGLRAYIWDDIGQKEWLTIEQVVINQGQGWNEIHAEENLINEYDKDDNPQVVVMFEVKYYIDETTEAAHPALMRSTNGLPAQVFAENIEDLQVVYLMKDGSTTSVPGSLQDVRVMQIELRARTERQDPDWTDQEYGDGYRRRSLTSWVDVRNLNI